MVGAGGVVSTNVVGLNALSTTVDADSGSLSTKTIAGRRLLTGLSGLTAVASNAATACRQMQLAGLPEVREFCELLLRGGLTSGLVYREEKEIPL